jgi:acetate kinase
LEFLGIELDHGRNNAGESIISKEGGKATVRVIRTDEEVQIAKSVWDVMASSSGTA